MLMCRLKSRLLQSLKRQRPTLKQRNTQHIRKVVVLKSAFVRETAIAKAKWLLS